MSLGERMCEQGYVTAEQLAEAVRIWPGHPDTIGAICLKLGFLKLDQIDVLLDEQSRKPRLFGELAIEKGFLTSQQVAALLQVQQLERDLAIGKVLVVAGHLTMDDLIAALTHHRTSSPQATGV